MEKFMFNKNWPALKLQLQHKWNRLMDEDLAHINGDPSKFVECLQKRYGFPKEHAERELANWNPEMHQKAKEPYPNKMEMPKTDYEGEFQKKKKRKAG